MNFTQPRYGVRPLIGHPLRPDVMCVVCNWTGHEPSGIAPPTMPDLVSGRTLTINGGRFGPADRGLNWNCGISTAAFATANTTEIIAANSSAYLPTGAVSIIIKHFASTPGAGRAFGPGVNPPTSELCSAHLPFIDGTVYWDFGGNSSGTTRLTFAAGTRNRWDVWGFTTGLRGMEIWRNGRKVASNSATPTRSSNSSGFGLVSPSASAFSELLYLYSTQIPEAAMASLTLHPYQIFPAPSRVSTFYAAASALSYDWLQPQFTRSTVTPTQPIPY